MDHETENKKIAQTAEEAEIDIKDVETKAQDNINPENPERDEADYSLDVDTNYEKPQTPPTDLPKFPFKYKGRNDPDRRGYHPRDGTQRKSDGSYTRRDGDFGSYNQVMGYNTSNADYRPRHEWKRSRDPREAGGHKLR